MDLRRRRRRRRRCRRRQQFFSSLFSSETTIAISFKFGIQLPYTGVYKNSSLHLHPIVDVAIATLLIFWGLKHFDVSSP